MRPGHVVVLVGAAALVASLWMPWYAVDVVAMRDAIAPGVDQLPAGLAGLGQLLDNLVATLPASVSASGWTALSSADVVLVAIATGVVVATLLGAGAREAATATALAGAVAVAIVLVHIVHGPQPGEVFSVRSGAWTALAGAIAIVVGALLVQRAPSAPAPVGAALASVAPPR